MRVDGPPDNEGAKQGTSGSLMCDAMQEEATQ
jgi:hypothetical protein